MPEIRRSLDATYVQFDGIGCAMRESRSIVKITNNILCLLLTMWVCWPYIAARLGMYLGVAIAVLWLLTAGPLRLLRCMPYNLFFVVIFFMTVVPYVITGTFGYGTLDPVSLLGTIALFFIGIAVSHYYMFISRDYVMLGRIALISMVAYILGSIQTIVGLARYPTASRELASSLGSMQHTYELLGIGGFGFVYGAVFICIGALFHVFGRAQSTTRLFRLVAIVTVAATFTMFIRASYTIAIMLAFLGGTCAVLVRNRRAATFAGAGLVFLALVPRESIGKCLMGIAGLFAANEVLSTKFKDLALVFLGETGQQTSYRLSLYMSSLEAFVNNPLFGLYGPLAGNGSVGGHSGWLDLLAYYGLFSAVPVFLAIAFTVRKYHVFFRRHEYLRFLWSAYICFLYFGLVNPVIYVYQVGFIVFAVVPSLPFLPQAVGNKGSVA